MRRVTEQARAFYRSPLTPVSFAVTGAFCAWALSPWGPPAWKTAASLALLHHAIPFPLMSAGFALYVLLLATQHIQAVIVADFLGAVIYLTEFVAVIWTARDGVTNPILVCAVFLAIILHALALRLAIFDKLLA